MTIVEVFSSNASMDRTVKRDLYERLEVPAYWMVDPGGPHRRPSILALRLEGGGYVTEAEATGLERFRTELPFAIEVVPVDLLG